MDLKWSMCKVIVQKNTDTKNLKVIRFTTTQNIHTPVIDTIRTIEEQPLDENSNDSNIEN